MPLKNYNGNEVVFSVRSRGETIFEHIANVSHQFKVRDIEQIPKILLNQDSVHIDKKSRKFKNYYGRRLGKNRKPYIKIITKLEKGKPEKITTIYTVRKKD
ncbi:MAG: hypothetical protein MJZ37_02110 [Bacilli bacterium]|nr:hypothetical protein [Bacilli bacterium]